MLYQLHLFIMITVLLWVSSTMGARRSGSLPMRRNNVYFDIFLGCLLQNKWAA